MNIVNTLIIAFLIFTLIWLARDFLMCQYWEFRWFHITGHSWKEDDDKVRDRALAEMARTGDKDRFDEHAVWLSNLTLATPGTDASVGSKDSTTTPNCRG